MVSLGNCKINSFFGVVVVCIFFISSPVRGFIRVLKFIAEFDFTQNPLILNFNQTFSIDKVSDIKDSFTTERPRLPVIFIVTPYDRKLSQHTRSTPSALIVYHMKKLARTLLENMTASFHQFKLPDIKVSSSPEFESEWFGQDNLILFFVDISDSPKAKLVNVRRNHQAEHQGHSQRVSSNRISHEHLLQANVVLCGAQARYAYN